MKQELEIGEKTLRNMDLITLEALIAPSSAYAGSKLEETDLGSELGFTVMGIARHGGRIHERPMATPLRYGDSLLLLGHISGVKRLEHNPNLILLERRMFPPLDKRKALLVLLLLLGFEEGHVMRAGVRAIRGRSLERHTVERMFSHGRKLATLAIGSASA